MMLIVSVIVMYSYIYTVCLVSRVLKDTYLKKHLSVIASKYSTCDMENKTKEFTLCSVFKYSPNRKGMIYCPNGKDIMVSMEYTLIIYSPNGKTMVLWNNRHGKR